MTNFFARIAPVTGLLGMLLFAAPMVRADITIFSNPFFGSSGDGIDRGFYLTSYPGTNLSTVTLRYNTDLSGSYTTTLTARLGSYSGTIIGTQTITTSLIAFTQVPVIYNFGGVAIAPGSVVTFTQTLVTGPGGGFVDYDTGSTGPGGIIETEETVPPLDVFRRSTVGIIVTQTGAPLTPVPPSILLMLTGLAGAGLFCARRRLQRLFAAQAGA